MKYKLTLLLLASLNVSTAYGCGGCSPNASKQIRNNIQSTPGNQASGGFGGGARIISARGAIGGEKPFKNEKVFDSVGKDQDDIDLQWSSSIDR